VLLCIVVLILIDNSQQTDNMLHGTELPGPGEPTSSALLSSHRPVRRTLIRDA
jgi:hypothetical protein